MRLTTVLGSTNANPSYYRFIPNQILFWGHFGIRFIAIFIGNELPRELLPYSDNIVVWNKNLNINTAFVSQNIRIYYPALLNLNDDEIVMITDMDMLPMSKEYYTSGLESFIKDDFIYYRHVDGVQIYMCYNAAHPTVWAKNFGIATVEDIETRINDTYVKMYNGVPGETGWFTDQEIMYKHLIHYPHLKILNRPIRRLETWMYRQHIEHGDKNFIHNYDDCHFHRDFTTNESYILDAQQQL